MPPAKRKIGIISCDPSWRGLAFTVIIPSMEVKESFLYDMKELDESKNYRHPVRSIKTIQRIYDDMFQKVPQLQLIDKVIMESQHKTNMQVLSWLIVSNLLPRISTTDVEYISPLTCKKKFDIALTGTHHGNKVAAVKFIEGAKNRLVASETVSEHNTADACLLLNTYLQTTKNIIYEQLDDWSSMAPLQVGDKFKCPKCKQNTGVLRFCEKKDSKFFNRYFLTCWWINNKGEDNEKKCGNFEPLYENLPTLKNGKVKEWVLVTGNENNNEEEEQDDDVVVTGSKRKLPEKKGPPSKKTTKIEAPLPPSVGDKPATQQQIVSALKKMNEAIKAVCADMESSLSAKIESLAEDMSSIKESLGKLMDLADEEKDNGEIPEREDESQLKVVTREELDDITF